MGWKGAIVLQCNSKKHHQPILHPSLSAEKHIAHPKAPKSALFSLSFPSRHSKPCRMKFSGIFQSHPIEQSSEHYELGNHLGNVLAVVTDNIHMADDLTTATVASASDYYPFGLQMDSRTVNDGDYRYGFNGKEKDQDGEFGNTHYDYGFRTYNPAIAKFLSVDPLTKSILN
jgi:RHS repeat-associated protein